MNRTPLSRCFSWLTAAATLGVAAALLVPCLAAESQTVKKPKRQQQRQRAGLPDVVTAAPPPTIMEVTPLDRSTRPAVQRAAAEIDRLLAASWQEHGVTASLRLNDTQFLRRTYL